MDPISASNFNLCNQEEDDTSELNNIVTSTKSLSNYEERNLKNLLPQISAACIATFNHIGVGIALAYSAILLPQLEKSSDISVTKSQSSWVASVLPLIAPIGSIMSAYLMDWLGRLNTLKLSVIPGLVGWVLIATASNLPMLLIGRIFSGLSSTLSTSPAVVYITEIARKDMRGSLLALGPSYVSLGMVIAYLKGWLLNWRLVAWLCNIYLILPFFFLFFLPESPIWLISKNRIEEARNALTWIHRNQPHLDFAELQLQSLIKENEEKKSQVGSTFKDFFKPTGYKPLLILSGLFFFQQFSGIYIFLFYSVSFFEAVGTSINPYAASIWIGFIRLIMSLLNTWMLKYLNRRMLIMISAFGMSVCTLISGFFTLWIKNGTSDMKYVPIVFLLMYVVFSMVGLLTIPWTMTAELFPLKIRSMAHSISTSIVNIIMFIAVQNYVNMEIAFGGSAGVQWFFSSISFLTVIYTFIFLPETHKKKLSEIEEYFKQNTIYLGQKKNSMDKQKHENINLIKSF